ARDPNPRWRRSASRKIGGGATRLARSARHIRCRFYPLRVSIGVMARQTTRATDACPMRSLRKSVSDATIVDGDGARIRRDGLALVPVEPEAFLVLVEPESGGALDRDVRMVVGVLAQLTAAALARVQRSASLRVSCDELRRLCTDVLDRQDGERGRTARELHE